MFSLSFFLPIKTAELDLFVLNSYIARHDMNFKKYNIKKFNTIIDKNTFLPFNITSNKKKKKKCIYIYIYIFIYYSLR